MSRQIYFLVVLSTLIVSSYTMASPYPSYERVTNRLGEVHSSISGLPIEELEKVLFPKKWSMRFTDDELRNHLVDFHSDQKWHEVLEQVGKTNHIVFLVDGAEKIVIAHLPGTGREPGVKIINSHSTVFREDPHTQDIFKRAQVNEVNWRRRSLQEEIRLNEERKRQIDESLIDMENERQRLERQSVELADKTADAIRTAESDNAGNSYSVTTQKPNLSSPKFVFYVKKGLVFGDNVYRMAEELGYESVTVDSTVPGTCDWEQAYEYTISQTDRLQAFTDYIAPYGFNVAFNKNTKDVYLKFVGDVSQFMGCNS